MSGFSSSLCASPAKPHNPITAPDVEANQISLPTPRTRRRGEGVLRSTTSES